MRTLTKPLAWMVLFAASIANAQADEIALCYEAKDHASQRECLERLVASTAREIEAAEQETAAAIQRWDEEPNFKATALKVLEESTASFQRYSESACRVDAAAAAGGNGASDMMLGCLYQLYKDRLQMLVRQKGQFDA